jgi:hypothetical protein
VRHRGAIIPRAAMPKFADIPYLRGQPS